jgi:hypothetical protein
MMIAISVKKQIVIAVIAMAVILIALTLLTCVEYKELSRETLRALGDTNDALPTYLPVSGCIETEFIYVQLTRICFLGC